MTQYQLNAQNILGDHLLARYTPDGTSLGDRALVLVFSQDDSPLPANISFEPQLLAWFQTSEDRFFNQPFHDRLNAVEQLDGTVLLTFSRPPGPISLSITQDPGLRVASAIRRARMVKIKSPNGGQIKESDQLGW